MQAGTNDRVPNIGEDPNAWRNQLALRLARGSAALYLVGTAMMWVAVTGRWQRPVMTLASFTCAVLAGIPATGWPTGKVRAWLVLLPAVIGTLAGFAIVGVLAGPAVVMTLTVMLAGLLLGKRAMLGVALGIGLAVAFIGWGMVSGHLPLPTAQNVSAANPGTWIRTVFLAYLAIALIGCLLIEVVGRMERSLEQAVSETLRRQQAERDKANAEILSLENKQLETIGRLAAGVAHDFNNNLTAVIGCSELLKDELTDNPSARELVEDVLTSARRAAELTRQLLAFSRKAQMVLVATDIHLLIEGAVALVRRSMNPRVEVVTKLTAENSIVLADATLLDNAILNLLVNAGDAMPNGGQLTVATTSYEIVEGHEPGQGLAPGKYLLVEVLDTGVGIESEILPNIFDPFFTTKSVGKGTGLGLAAVSGTIKAHSGSIAVESEAGCGTAFRILLPCSTAQEVNAKHESNVVTRGSGEILLVDDDALVRRTAAATLRNLGYNVTTANDGLCAMEAFDAAPAKFDLIILDLRMPRMSGEETFRALRSRVPNIPVVLWSGFGAEQDVAMMLRNGAAGFVQKPYRVAELSLVVNDAIRANQQRKAASRVSDPGRFLRHRTGVR
jgi:signal transduction histidine kinase/CheY-like chemotaxis protein